MLYKNYAFDLFFRLFSFFLSVTAAVINACSTRRTNKNKQRSIVEYADMIWINK